MSKKVATELEVGALSAWTRAQQAALNAHQVVQQTERDEEEADKKEEAKKKDKDKSDVRPDAVSAGKVIDDIVGFGSLLNVTVKRKRPSFKDLLDHFCPPLFAFLESFGPPHIVLLVLIALHVGYIYSVPWYFRFISPFPLIYGLPMYGTIASVYTLKDRALWQAYWVELLVLEYLEMILFGDKSRSLVFLPMIKTVLCIVLYSAIDYEPGTERDPKTKHRIQVPVYGAIKLIKLFVPALPDSDTESASEENEGQKGKDDKKSRSGASSSSAEAQKRKDEQARKVAEEKMKAEAKEKATKQAAGGK